MRLSRLDACEKLELPPGADKDSVRTSYKRLALKWHPDKHDGANRATKKFEEISIAYKRLTEEDIDSDDELIMTQNACFEQFRQVFIGRTIDAFSNGYDSSDEDDDEDDDDSDDQDFVGTFTDYYKSRQDFRTNKEGDDSPRFSLTAEEIEKNANELITEEEREKRKAEKRRAKKKRRREKKKVEKQKADHQKKEEESHGKQNGTAETKKKKSEKKSKDSTSEVEEFDQNAAFFTKVVSKKKKVGSVPEQPTGGKGKSKAGDNKAKEEDAEDLDPVVLRSRQLAIRGNQMATVGHYHVAIDLFTEAIKLDPRDFRFFGNRSYCYDRISKYDRALGDADKAISIASDWPKGYFRKGRALAGLKLYADAEQAFMQVLKLDRNCEDAMTELLRVRTFQLTEMGFSQEQAESAIKRFGSVQQALDSLLAGVGKDLRLRSHGNNKSFKVAENSLVGEVYVSDDDDPVGASSHVTSKSFNNSAAVPRLQQQQQPQYSSHIMSTTQQSQNKKQPADVKMNPNNPEGLTALWVGNVLPEVTEKQLRDMFGKHGTVTSVRCLPEKYCAFINYKTKESAGRAMANLQHEECAGQKLLIKFPDNPIVNGNVVIRKNTPAVTNKNTNRPMVGSTTGNSNSTTTSNRNSLNTALRTTTNTNANSTNFKKPSTAELAKPKPQHRQPTTVPGSTKISLIPSKNLATVGAGADDEDPADKPSGPVNGDECYFWRTTGCQFGKACRYKHIKEHKGIDKKPWQIVK